MAVVLCKDGTVPTANETLIPVITTESIAYVKFMAYLQELQLIRSLLEIKGPQQNVLLIAFRKSISRRVEMDSSNVNKILGHEV